MSIISLKNISKTYAGRRVLDELSLTLNTGDRLALIGDNGSGKSTLLRIIAGEETPDPDLGTRHVSDHNPIGYLHQHVATADGLSAPASSDPGFEALKARLNRLEKCMALANDNAERRRLYETYADARASFDALDGHSFDSRMEKILLGLGLKADITARPLETLSGGERMRVALARILVREPDLLLLDEPTNHLDAEATEWLEDFLLDFNGAVLFVSHDRAFINRVATSTAELAFGRLTLYRGNYRFYTEQRDLQRESLDNERKRTEAKLIKQRGITQTMLSHNKIASYHSSQKKEARLEAQLEQIKTRLCTDHKRLRFRFEESNRPRKHRDEPVLDVDGLTVRFDDADTPLFRNLSFRLMRGEHVVLVGPNGCGKSTLLNAVMGTQPLQDGICRTAPALRYGFMGQTIRFDHEHLTVLETLCARHPHLTEEAARSELARVGFVQRDVFQRVDTLSGGERARLYLSLLICDRPDVLFLDEPTNHLDIRSREWLEDALDHFDGSILAVSHDRYFIDRLAHRVLAMAPDRLMAYRDYGAYRRDRKRASDSATDQAQKKTASEPATTPSTPEDAILVWSDAECALRPALAQLRTLPTTPAERRRTVALINQLIRETEDSLAAGEKRAAELERTFAGTDSPSLYHEYAELLQLCEQEESVLLRLYEWSDAVRRD